MPIYEYYCHKCRGRFSHLARRYGEPSPPCPRCSNTSVERLISAPHVVHTSDHHEQELQDHVSRVDAGDARAAAEALQASGRLADTDGLYGSPAYRELVFRRAQGATDADVGDLVDDLVAAADVTPAAELASLVALSDQVDNRMGAEGPPQGHERGAAVERAAGQDTVEGPKQPAAGATSRRAAQDLGWG